MNRRPLRLLLAGANWRERTIASIGALIAIGLTALVSTWVMGSAQAGLPLVAPIGASAVLLFTVPSSPVGQPWSVIGGNVISALVGVCVARWFGHDALASGLAVGLSIVAMSALRCLHPAGGGATLLPVLGGPAVLAHGFAFALVPVGLNAILLVAVGVVFHRLSGRSYPHRAAAMPAKPRLHEADIEAALAETGESFDIGVEDLLALLERAEQHARIRDKPAPRRFRLGRS
jgi:CBS domain-containing membrane protein